MTFKHMYERDILQLCKDQIEHVTDVGQTRPDRAPHSQPMEIGRLIFSKSNP